MIWGGLKVSDERGKTDSNYEKGGVVKLDGRSKDMIIRGGENIQVNELSSSNDHYKVANRN